MDSNQLKIDLGNIDARDFYGAENRNLEKISALYPGLKIVGRGNTVTAIGEKSLTEQFEQRFLSLLDYYEKYGHISEKTVEQHMASGGSIEEPAPDNDIILYGNSGLVVRARTVNQKQLVREYERKDLLFAEGPAGSGKTYTAIALAVRALRNKEVKRIILTRPAVEAGEKLGFLPGDMKEKLDPYLQPLYDALNDMIPAVKLSKYIEDGTVQIAPLAFMRGRTLDNAFVILDEAQNTSLSQIKMFLTRMGRNAKFIVTGDQTQIDLPRPVESGLRAAIELLTGIKGIGVIRFDKRDIVRHPLVKKIVEAFEQADSNGNLSDTIPTKSARPASLRDRVGQDNDPRSVFSGPDGVATDPGLPKSAESLDPEPDK